MRKNSTVSLIRIALVYQYKLDGSGNVPLPFLGTVLVDHVVTIRDLNLVCCGR